MGASYRIRGYVTAGTENPYNRFPDTIYVQDDTGGIAVMPFDTEGIPVGQPLEITGCLAAVDGNLVLDFISYRELDYRSHNYEGLEVSLKDAADDTLYGGQLLQIQGKVTALTKSGNAVSQFTLEDDDGNTMDVLIEDAIFSGATGKNTLASVVKKGRTVRAIGICHVDEEENAVLRVRNCDEVVYIPAWIWWDNPQTGDRIGGQFSALLLSAMALALILKQKKAAG